MKKTKTPQPPTPIRSAPPEPPPRPKWTMATVIDLVVDLVRIHHIIGLLSTAEAGRSVAPGQAFFNYERSFGISASINVTVDRVLAADDVTFHVRINTPACERTVAQMIAQQALTDEVLKLAALIETSIIRCGKVAIE